MRNEEAIIYGRNATIEALRAGREVERIFLIKGSEDGPIRTILRETKKKHIQTDFVTRERLSQLCGNDDHQGVVAFVAAFSYASIDDILRRAEERKEPPFIIILDGIEDPHNLGAIIRTANAAGAHGVIVAKHHAAGLSPAAVKASAGAVNFTPVAQVTNISKTIEQLKDAGMWFVCADMDGEPLYRLNLSGSMGLVIGNEGKGISPLVKKHCDYIASIPMRGEIESLNASVACGVLAYEIVRARMK